MEWFVSAWTIWGLGADWMLSTGTEASKGWFFCGDAARSRISQDRKNVLFEKLCILWFWIYLQDSGLVTTAGFALGGRLNWRNDERELVERISSGDGGCKTLTITQDRQNMYLFWELFRLWPWKIAGPVLRLHAMCGNWIIGFKRSGVIWSWGASEVLKVQGLVKCWHFGMFGLCG